MFKKLIAAGAALAVALGIVAIATIPAQAHTGDLNVNAVCNTSTGNYDFTATLAIANTSLNGSTVYKVGTPAFDHTPKQTDPSFGGTPIVSTHNPSTITLTTFSLPGTTTGKGPWIYAQTTFTDKYFVGSDGQLLNNLKGDCTAPATLGTIDKTVATCDTAHPGQTTQASFVVDGGSHISYTYTLNGGAARPLTPGTPVPVDVTSGDVAVVVTPTADGGYRLPSYDATAWNFTLAKVTTDCVQHLTVDGSMTPKAAVCTADDQPGTGEMDFSAGLPTGAKWVYSLTGPNAGDFQDVPAGLAITGLAPGTTVYGKIVPISAGYTVAGNIGPFTKTVPSLNASDCVVVPTIAQTQAVCDSTSPGTIPVGKWTVPTTPGVTYSVGGKTVTGPQTVDVEDQPVTVVVTATATGTHQFANGAKTQDITLTFQPLDHTGCVFDATIGVPKFVDETCTVDKPGQRDAASYTLPAAVGIDYYVDGVKTPADTYSAKNGSTVKVTEQAQKGYQLAGDYPAGGYSHTFSAGAGDCLNPTAKFTDPGFNVETCSADNKPVSPSITVPSIAHVNFSVDGNAVAGGTTVPVTVGVPHTVTVTTDAGWKLPADATYPDGGWTWTPTRNIDCDQLPTDALVDPSFLPHAAGCFTQASYTLSSDQDSADPNAVIWTVNGARVAAGTYPLAAGQSITVHAEPNATYGFPTPTTADWRYTATASAGACDLKTLALTGVGSASAFLGFGYLAVIAGLSLVAVAIIRRRRSTEE
jgi:hypothetical protein